MCPGQQMQCGKHALVRFLLTYGSCRAIDQGQWWHQAGCQESDPTCFAQTLQLHLGLESRHPFPPFSWASVLECVLVLASFSSFLLIQSGWRGVWLESPVLGILFCAPRPFRESTRTPGQHALCTWRHSTHTCWNEAASASILLVCHDF